jgi:hypothetical protein
MPCCAEQEGPGLVGMGLEMSDLIIAYAPRPYLILGQKDDFFDPRGTLQTFQQARKFYSLLEKTEMIDHLIGRFNHDYHIDSRHKMYNFFARHLGFDFQHAEVAVLPRYSRKELNCTPSGSVLDLPGAKHPRTAALKLAEKFAAERKSVPVEKRMKQLGQLLEIDNVAVPYYRNLRLLRHFDTMKHFIRFGLETEREQLMSILYVPYVSMKNNHISCDDTVELFIPHRDAVSEFLNYPNLNNASRYMLDMRGVGAMTPGGCQSYSWWGDPELHSYLPESLNKCDSFGRGAFAFYNYDYHYWACGEMLGKPYLGGRVRDILGTLKLLASSGAKHIRLVAREQGVYPAVLAALFFKDCKVSIECNELPPSYGAIMKQEIPQIPHSSLVTGILKYFDLPEMIALVNSKK